MTVTLDHCVIAVTDWERSNAFYRDVLRAEVVERGAGLRVPLRRPAAQRPRAGRHADPVAADPVRPGNSDLCFHWHGPDRGRASSTCAASACPSSSVPSSATARRGDGTSVYFRDPDGSLLEFITY